MKFKTEDQVRDEARNLLKLEEDETAQAGVGQLTTFNQLGFSGIADKPDGWYLPENHSKPAMILEVKSTKIELGQAQVDELQKNIHIVSTQYAKVVGILYNGESVRVFQGEEEVPVPDTLQPLSYYLDLFEVQTIDKEKIYQLTAKINDCLHFEFGVKNLYHRMIFTACALVAERYGGRLKNLKNLGYSTFHTAIHSTLSKSLEKDRKQNIKIDILLDEYSGIKMNTTDNQDAINSFIDWVVEISECVNSNDWRGEDVMGIFFNEFNRYKKKSEAGQVFTPEHMTDFIYRILNVTKTDYILDATCGSGGFLVKAMSNMIQEAGGMNTKEARKIKSKHLYGIEFDREIYALACANMLIHKDGKTNLEQMDARTEEAGEWIAEKRITKVLMNPPYENKYGCMTIVENVLDHVPLHTQCAFILPEKKLEKASKKQVERILKHHRLKKVIKLPEDLFFGVGVTTSIFIFESGIPQDEKQFFACYMESDGLVTVKNKGRHDVHGKWPAIEDYWVDVVEKQSGDSTCQWINPKEHLSYQVPPKPFSIREEDFQKTALDYLLWQKNVNVSELREKLMGCVMYGSELVDADERSMTIRIEKGEEKSDTSQWKAFKISDLGFSCHHGVRLNKNKRYKGDILFITAGKENKGASGYIGNDCEIFEKCISVDMFGNCFYHDERCSGDDNVYFFVNEQLSELEKQFIATSIDTYLGNSFSYAEQFRQTNADQLFVYLPATPDGDPDWEWMESYMQSQMEKASRLADHLDRLLV